ncbi:MAG: O-antigen ligase family protein [Planctomycetes bacterium]|nr:O-antigen ligase family protein [Planctomycetota bacterium]
MLIKESKSPVPSQAWGIAALIAVALIPLAFGLQMPLTSKRALTLTPFEPVIWIVALWLLLAWFKAGDLPKRFKAFSRSAYILPVLIVFALLSALGAKFSYDNAKSLFAKSLLQWIEYLLLAVLVFHTLLSDPVWRKRAVTVFCLTGMLTVASVYIMAEYFGKIGHFQGGWLLNRNSYGSFLVLWGPVMLAFPWLNQKHSRLKLLIGSLAVVAGLYFCTSGGPFLGVLLAALIMMMVASKYDKAWSPGIIFLVIILPVFFFILKPANNLNALIDSVQVYVPFKDPETGLTTREHTMRYYRWSANLEMIADNPFNGVGLGQYGKRVNEYYAGINLPAGQTDIPELYNVKANEPFSFSWFFLAASELGLVGAAVLLLLLANLAVSAVEKITRNDWGGWVVLAALAGLGIAGWFTSPMVRGVGGALAFIIALALSRAGNGESAVIIKRRGEGEQDG